MDGSRKYSSRDSRALDLETHTSRSHGSPSRGSSVTEISDLPYIQGPGAPAWALKATSLTGTPSEGQRTLIGEALGAGLGLLADAWSTRHRST